MVLKRKKDCDILIVEREKWNYMEKSVQKVKYLADFFLWELKLEIKINKGGKIWKKS